MAATSVASKMAHQSTEPVMGCPTLTSADKWIAQTFGKPKKDWSGFVDKALVDFKWANQARPICDIKGCNHRKTGLSAKFKKSDLLIPFKKQA